MEAEGLLDIAHKGVSPLILGGFLGKCRPEWLRKSAPEVKLHEIWVVVSER